MNILIVLMPIALLLSVSAVWAFIKAVKSGQFEDLDTPAYRALLEETERKVK